MNNYIKLYLHPHDSSCDIDVTEFKETTSKFIDDNFVTDFRRRGVQYRHAECEVWCCVKSLSHTVKCEHVAKHEVLKVAC